MPQRYTPLVAGETYHVFNRGIARMPTFTDKREYGRALQAIEYYQYVSLPAKLSVFLAWSGERRDKALEEFKAERKKLIQIFAYCLMPNHFHFLMRQEERKGISLFIGKFLNSYTRYFNTKHDRDGALFLDQFKAVRMETEEQLVHVSRYIHLNPYSSHLVRSVARLKDYPWSSFREYLDARNKRIIDDQEVLDVFSGSRKRYEKFVLDQADYQRELEAIKHLVFE